MAKFMGPAAANLYESVQALSPRADVTNGQLNFFGSYGTLGVTIPSEFSSDLVRLKNANDYYYMPSP